MIIQIHRYNITQGAGFYSAVGSASVSRGQRFESQPGYVEIDHEIISTVIHPFPLYQEGQLSVTGETSRKHTYIILTPLNPSFIW